MTPTIHLCGLHDKAAHTTIMRLGGTIYNASTGDNQFERVQVWVPGWDLVRSYLKFTGHPKFQAARILMLDEQQYTTAYLGKIDHAQVDRWVQGLHEHTGLVCFCKSVRQGGTFCHLDLVESYLWQHYARRVKVIRY